jgi:hypothetical protein
VASTDRYQIWWVVASSLAATGAELDLAGAACNDRLSP